MGNKQPNATLLYCCIKETIKQTLQIPNAITKFSIMTLMMPGLFLELFTYWILMPLCKDCNNYLCFAYKGTESLLWLRPSVMSDFLQPQRLQLTRLPCPSLSPRVCSNSCPLSGWCHPTISSSVVPFSSRLQSFPASGSFPMSQLFASGGQSTGASASASVLQVNIQDSFPLGLTGLISFLSKDSQESSPAPQFESISSPALSFPYAPTTTSVHDYRKTIALPGWIFVGKVMNLLFNTLSRCCLNWRIEV